MPLDIASPRRGDPALAARLKAALKGEVLFDAFSRGRYATDASIYQEMPVGVFVPRAAEAARYLRDQVPGIDVPEDVVHRLDSVPTDRQRAEGIRLALELVEEVRMIPGVSGVHLMTIKNEEAIVEVIEGAGLLPRPSSVPQTVG